MVKYCGTWKTHTERYKWKHLRSLFSSPRWETLSRSRSTTMAAPGETGTTASSEIVSVSNLFRAATGEIDWIGLPCVVAPPVLTTLAADRLTARASSRGSSRAATGCSIFWWRSRFARSSCPRCCFRTRLRGKGVRGEEGERGGGLDSGVRWSMFLEELRGRWLKGKGLIRCGLGLGSAFVRLGLLSWVLNFFIFSIDAWKSLL